VFAVVVYVAQKAAAPGKPSSCRRQLLRLQPRGRSSLASNSGARYDLPLASLNWTAGCGLCQRLLQGTSCHDRSVALTETPGLASLPRQRTTTASNPEVSILRIASTPASEVHRPVHCGASDRF